MSFTRRVDLEGDLISRTRIGERGDEQPPGRLNQRRIRLPREVDRDSRTGDPARADLFRQVSSKEAGGEQLIS